MAFFKSKKGGDDQPTPAPAPESVEAMRTRAKHRLIGAAVLVLIGVVGFPLLFDNQPRPVAVDIPIEIPDKNKVKPLVQAPAAVPAAKASAVVDERAAPVAAEPAPVKVAPKPVAKPVEKQSEKPAVKTPEKVAEKPADKPADKPKTTPTDGAKAQALLDGKEPDKTTEKAADKTAEKAAALAGRFVVQVGAYADADKAREVRAKLEKAGLKTYTQVVQPKEGKRIRVRVGPFESKVDADKAAEKIKSLDLPAGILQL